MFARIFCCCRGNNPELIKAAHDAVKAGDEATLTNLLNQGLNPNCREKKGDFTLLHRAVISTNERNIYQMMPILELILSYKADPNEFYKGRDSYFSPLQTAARRALPEVVELLIQNKANIDFKSDKGKTALDYAEAIENILRKDEIIANLEKAARNKPKK